MGSALRAVLYYAVFCCAKQLPKVMLYVDLHGHSKKSNIFMYGVENPTDEGLYMRERVIPTLLDRASSLFNLKDCSFDVSPLPHCPLRATADVPNVAMNTLAKIWKFSPSVLSRHYMYAGL